MRALLLLAILLAGCASEGPASGETAFPDVHGVGIDATDPSVVYVATHVGLFRHAGGTWTQVGDTRHDLMGFTVAPNGSFFASGHPKGGGNLGFLRSDDAGLTWKHVGAEGADFHAMSASPADPLRVYAWYRGHVYRSEDAGAGWAEAAKTGIASLAAHPTRADSVYGASTASLGRSDDGGRTWRAVASTSAYGVAAGDALYAGGRGFVERSDDEGASWTNVTPPASTGVFAHLATRGATVVAATYEGAVWRSDDEGATWSRIHE